MHVFIVYKGLFLIDKIMKHYFIRFYYLKRSMKISYIWPNSSFNPFGKSPFW